MKEKTKFLTPEEYREIFSKVPRVCVDLFVKHGDKVLLEKLATQPFLGMWGLVGGGIRYQETVQEALERHSRQEIGVGIKSASLLEVKEYLAGADDWRHSISLNYIVVLKKGKLRENIEWFDTIPENTVPVHVGLLRRWGYNSRKPTMELASEFEE